MSINNSPEADIYVPMTREEAAYNNMSNSNNTAIEQTNQSQNDSEHNNNSSGSNMISNVLNEVNTFIDSLDSPPLFAAPPSSSLPPPTKDDDVQNEDGARETMLKVKHGAPNNTLPPPPSYEEATSYSIADELNNLHIDRIHSDHGTGVECNVCPPSSLTSLTPPQTASLTTVTTALTQPQTALTKADDNDQKDGGMINQSEELFTSLSSRYHQQQEDQQQQVKPDSFEDENHIGNVVIGTSTTTESEEIEDNNNIIKASEELYNKILQEEHQQKQEEINLQNKTAAAVLKKEIEHNIQEREDITGNDEVSEVTKASEELYNKINSNINSSDSITAMESYSVGGEESIDISVTATKNNNNEKTSQFNWNREVPRSQRRSSSSSSYRQVSASATVLPPSMPSNQVQRKNTATTSTPTDDQAAEKSEVNKVHKPSTNLQPSSNLQPRVAKPTTQKVLSPFSSKARRVIHTLQTIKAEQAQSSNCNERFGLQNCRRVSLLLKVSSHSQQQQNVAADSGKAERETDEDGYGPILYPALVDQEAAAVDGREGEEVKSAQLMKHGEVILVNPNAFDAEDNNEGGNKGPESDKAKKRIAGRVTVETAKLVAEVVSLLLYFDSIHPTLLVLFLTILINRTSHLKVTNIIRGLGKKVSI